MREQLLNYLASYISFESTEHNPAQKRECLDWLTSIFLHHDLRRLERSNDSVAPYVYLPNPSAPLLWFAHIDVVPANPEQFILKVEGDKAYGRGVKDMKGSALPFLMAYEEARARGEHPAISILLTSDEEVSGGCIADLLDEKVIAAPAAFTPDTGASPDLVTEHKGAVWADLVAKGKGGHASGPWEAENPIPKLMEVIAMLQKKFPMGTESDWQITVTPTELQGSNARNKIPDTAVCGLDIRFPYEVCKTTEEAVELVRKELPPGFKLLPSRYADPHQTDPDHPMVKLVRETAESVIGQKINIGKEHGSSDARYFAAKGIPSFLYGPTGGDLHGSKEWVSIDSLLQHYEIYQKLFQKLGKYQS